MTSSLPEVDTGAALSRIRMASAGAIMLVFALTALYAWQDRRESVQRAEERALLLSGLARGYVSQRLRETESFMRAMGELYGDGTAGNAAVREIGLAHLRIHPTVVAIGIVEAGRIELLVGETQPVRELRVWAATQTVRREALLVGRPLRIEGMTVPVLPLLLLRSGADGRLVTLVAALRADLLAPMHRAVRLAENAVSAIVDGGGVVLARHPFDPRGVGRSVAGTDAFSDVPAGRAFAAKLFVSPLDGNTYFLGMHRLDAYGLTVRAGENWGPALAPWYERTLRGALVAVVLAGVIVLLGHLAWQRTVREGRERRARLAEEAQHRDALSTLTEGVVSHAPDGSVRTFNAAALRILCMSEEQLRGSSSLDPRWRARRADGSDLPGTEHPAMRALATGKPQLGQLMDIQAGDGSRHWLMVNAVPTFEDGAVSGAVVSFADVTEQRATAARIEHLNRTLEARVAERTREVEKLGRELAEAEERERREIAHDLHDDIAQLLAAARIRLAGLGAHASPQALPVALAVGDLLDRADRSIRSLASQLAPPALAEMGIVAGLEWLAEEMGRVYGLAVDLHDDSESKPMTQASRAVVFRAVRELLINVGKHAGVAHAVVAVHAEAGQIVVEVSDEGRGFDPRNAAGGLGLRGMRERLAYIGGSLDWRAAPGAGTTAVVVAPLSVEAGAHREAVT